MIHARLTLPKGAVARPEPSVRSVRGRRAPHFASTRYTDAPGPTVPSARSRGLLPYFTRSPVEDRYPVEPGDVDADLMREIGRRRRHLWQIEGQLRRTPYHLGLLVRLRELAGGLKTFRSAALFAGHALSSKASETVEREIGKEFKRRREELQWSRPDVSRRIRDRTEEWISPETIENFENGRFKLSFSGNRHKVRTISGALGNEQAIEALMAPPAAEAERPAQAAVPVEKEVGAILKHKRMQWDWPMSRVRNAVWRQSGLRISIPMYRDLEKGRFSMAKPYYVERLKALEKVFGIVGKLVQADLDDMPGQVEKAVGRKACQLREAVPLSRQGLANRIFQEDGVQIRPEILAQFEEGSLPSANPFYLELLRSVESALGAEGELVDLLEPPDLQFPK